MWFDASVNHNLLSPLDAVRYFSFGAAAAKDDTVSLEAEASSPAE